jgi:hypothetical protein
MMQVTNERAWTNPTPTPWGRDSKIFSIIIFVTKFNLFLFINMQLVT